MSLTVSCALLEFTQSESLRSYRELAANVRGDHEHAIDLMQMDEPGLQDIIAAATSINDTKTAQAAEAIMLARTGTFSKPVPNFKAFQGILESFLRKGLIDGWIYVAGDDGKLYPELVTEITFDSGASYNGKRPLSVRIHTVSYGYSSDGNYKIKFGIQTRSHGFEPQSVVRRRVADALARQGIYKETTTLKDAYFASLARHREVTMRAFAQQFRVNGAAYHYEDKDYQRRGTEIQNRKVIHDLEPSNYGAFQNHIESVLFVDHPTAGGVGEIPEHPVVRVFDLNVHEFFWVHSDNMTPYVYDQSLREKLVLPQTHRDLLDVLTTDLDALTSDIIEGKSAGNVILCKGIAGVGKTLTAEVYAELIERPLYAIHSGNLGTTAEQIDKNLRQVFLLSKRWNCVLLLDEADVFVVRRGNNIQQNAIVAEFLRTLEYFDGLLFMTTNRPDDIDDAIISRCAAIISYAPPGREDAAAIWRVMAAQYDVILDGGLVDDLVKIFPTISPRDIKMLFRLALRVSASRQEPLSLDVFRRCAMFRAIEIRAEREPTND